VSTAYFSVNIDTMAPVPHDSSDDVLFAEASGWFARLHADDVTAEERRQFLRWCAQSADHARAWDQVQELFGNLHTHLRLPSMIA
jgi:transmembrane sensor